MDEIIFRTACAVDLERTFENFVTASNELLVRRHLPLIQYDGTAPLRSLAFRHHVLVHDAQRFWVAEDCGTVIGFGIATLRESLW